MGRCPWRVRSKARGLSPSRQNRARSAGAHANLRRRPRSLLCEIHFAKRLKTRIRKGVDEKYQKRLGWGSADLRRGSRARASSAAGSFSLAIAQGTLQRPAVRTPTRAPENRGEDFLGTEAGATWQSESVNAGIFPLPRRKPAFLAAHDPRFVSSTTVTSG